MKTYARFLAYTGAGIVAALSACTATDAAVPCLLPPGIDPDQTLAVVQACSGCTTQTVVDPRRHNDLDILFVIDNSPSMATKQKALAAALPQFMATIEKSGANYHIGIVTSDLGIEVPDGSQTGIPFAHGGPPACNTAAGDDGVLQNTPCTSRVGLQGEAALACAAVCPEPTFVPATGARYILKSDGVTNVPPLIRGGADIGPEQIFQCLALVGDGGCGVQMPLEAARRALDDHRPENRGFNRGTSVLAIVFITDKDDCSVLSSRRSMLDPATSGDATLACTTPTPTPGVSPQCFDLSYRCLASDVACAQPMNTPGPKTSCQERPDGFLGSIDEYVSFLSSLPNPNVIIAGIWSPTVLDNPYGDPAKDGQLFVDYVNGPMDSAGLGSGRKTHAACYNPDPTLTANPNGLSGQAQLRLSSFIRRFNSKNTTELSICDTQSYASALAVIPDNIANNFGADCLPEPPRILHGTPACVVGYVDATNPEGTPDFPLPACSAKCCDFFATDPNPFSADDPNLMPNPHLEAKLAACSADPDCYCAVPNQANCANAAVAGLWRHGNASAPPGKVVSFRCAGPAGCMVGVRQ